MLYRKRFGLLFSVQVSLMIFALEGSYHYSSQAGLQDFILRFEWSKNR